MCVFKKKILLELIEKDVRREKREKCVFRSENTGFFQSGNRKAKINK